MCSTSEEGDCFSCRPAPSQRRNGTREIWRFLFLLPVAIRTKGCEPQILRKVNGQRLTAKSFCVIPTAGGISRGNSEISP